MAVEQPARALEMKVAPIPDRPRQLLNSEVPLRYESWSANIGEGIVIPPILKQLRISMASCRPRRSRSPGPM